MLLYCEPVIPKPSCVGADAEMWNRRVLMCRGHFGRFEVEQDQVLQTLKLPAGWYVWQSGDEQHP